MAILQRVAGLNRIFNSKKAIKARKAKGACPNQRLLRFESLEKRDLLTVFIAANLTDDTAAETGTNETQNTASVTFTRNNMSQTPFVAFSFYLTGDSTATVSDILVYNGNTLINSNNFYDEENQCYCPRWSVIFGFQEASVTLTIKIYNDSYREGTETASFALVPDMFYECSDDVFSVSIMDNDDWTVSVEAADDTATETEDNYGSYTVTRSGGTDATHSLNVDFSIAGTAVRGLDYALYTASGTAVVFTHVLDPVTQIYFYRGRITIPINSLSATISLQPVDDTYAERDETAILTLIARDTASGFGKDYDVSPTGGNAMVTIEESTEITLTTLDDKAFEPCTWISGNDRKGAFRLTVSTTETNWSGITAEITLGGTATPGNSGSSGDYHLTKNPNGGVASDIISMTNGTATVIIPGNTNSFDFYVMPNGDAFFEPDETVIMEIAQAYSGYIINQVDYNDEDVNPVLILQAPEFVSDTDDDYLSTPVYVNSDYYVKYIDPDFNYTTFRGNVYTYAVIPMKRYCRYAFYSSENGNTLTSSETDPLLSINAVTGRIKVLRAMSDAELTAALNFQIKVYDSVYTDLYDLATLELEPIELSLVPYTPSTTYFDPMQIPDELWKENDVGIRRNRDFDNGDSSLADSSFVGVCNNENDLIRVDINIVNTEGVIYYLRRNSSNLKCWHSPTKSGGEYEFDGNECEISGSCSIWVEYLSSENSPYTLALVAEEPVQDADLLTKRMTFRPFNSITCAFVGEFEIAGNPQEDPGINNWVIEQLLEGYDVHVWDDGYDYGNTTNDCDRWGEGRALNEIANAINNRCVSNVALIGYSHGGGSVYNLSWRMNYDGVASGNTMYANPPRVINNTYTLSFTSYIDAIANSANLDFFAENRRPLGSAFHVNQYQENSVIHGCSITDSDDDLNRSDLNLNHSDDNLTISIDTNNVVVDFLTTRFRQRITK